MLHILHEVSLVLYPLIAQHLQMAVVEVIVEHFDVLVVEHPVAIEHVFLPLSLVGDFVAGIVEDAFAFHPVSDPLSAVLAAFLVVERAEAMAVLA